MLRRAPGWIHEIKHDGFRSSATLSGWLGMREVIIGATMLLLLSGTARAAGTGDVLTGNSLLESCRSLFDPNFKQNRDERAGVCLGIVATV
jgi:hypothetical protein